MPFVLRTAGVVALVLTLGAVPARSADEPAKHEGKTLGEWVAVMNDTQKPYPERRHAARVLGRFGKPAVAPLVAAFGGDYRPDRAVKGAAAGSLARIGGDDVRDALVTRLRDRNWEVQRSALVTVWLMKDPGKAAPALAPVLASTNLEMRALVEQVMPEIDTTAVIPHLVNDYRTGGRDKVLATVEPLCLLGPAAKPALEDARKHLKYDDKPLVYGACRVIRAIGPGAEPAIPDLIRALTQNDFNNAGIALFAEEALVGIGKPAVEPLLGELRKSSGVDRERVYNALARMSPHSDAALPDLVAVIETRKGPIPLSRAVLCLEHYTHKADAVVPALTSVVADPKLWYSHTDALRGLARFGPKAKSAAPKVAALLAAKDPFVKTEAVKTLGAIGPDARDGVPALLGLMTQEHKPEGININSELAAALPKIGPACVPGLIEVLDAKDLKYDRRTEMLELAAKVLGQLGPDAKAAAPKLRQLVRAPGDPGGSDRVRAACLEALGRIQADPKDDVPLIGSYLDEKQRVKESVPVVAAAAARALGSSGPAAKGFAPELLRIAKTEKAPLYDRQKVIAAILALPEVGAGAEKAIPIMVEHLEREDSAGADLTTSTLVAMEKYGPKAEGAIPVLLKILDSHEPAVRAGACRVLGAIGPGAKAAHADLREIAYDDFKEVRAAAKEAIGKIEK